MNIRAVACTVAVLLMASACSLTSDSGDDATPSASPSSTPSPTGTETDGDSEPNSEPSDLENTGVSEAPVITGGPQTLTLDDAFLNEAWEDGEFDPAAVNQPTQRALAAVVPCPGDQFDDDANVLDFRFSDVSGTLEVEVAQDTKSTSTTGQVEFSLEVDDRRADVRNVGFKDAATLRSNLSDVTVVRVDAHQLAPDGDCDGSVTALITKIAVVDD